MILRWMVLLSFVVIAYLCGFNQGMNEGVEVTMKYDPRYQR